MTQQIESRGVPTRELLRHHGRRPHLTDRELVPRERVLAPRLERLEESMVLVAAPAGYGKTTFLAQWEDADERPFAWISLDGRYNDPVLLLGSIAAAVDEIAPLDDAVFAPLLSPRPNLWKVVVPRLCHALRQCERPFVIVLDDLHNLSNPEAFRPLPELASALRAGGTLAIASREEPEMPLGRLRTQRRLGEVRAPDLTMTAPEAADLLEQAGLELDGAAVERLVERTEGWPAGLYLAALALGAEDDLEQAVENFYGDDRFVADYVRDSFLDGLPAPELDFLTRTSLLDRLFGPLCDAILERDGSAETLRRMRRSNMLLVPLDRRDHEYRYHPLLQEMLRSELRRRGPKTEAQLHRRASDWYAEHDDVEGAVKHAIEAGDRGRAGDLIWANTAAYVSRGRDATLRHWLSQFSEREITASPSLCLTAATTSLSAGDGARVENWTSAALEGLKDAPPDGDDALALAGRLIRATGAARDGVAQMGAEVAGIYELLPGDSPWRSACRLIEGTSQHLLGELEPAQKLLEEGSRRGGATAPHIQTLCLAQLALIALDNGDQGRADALAEEAIAEVHHFGLTDYPSSSLIFAVAALSRARTGSTADATRDLRKATELTAELNDLSPWYEAEVRVVAARALLLLDDLPAARAHLAQAARFLHRTADATVIRGWIEQAWAEIDTAGSVVGRWPLSPAELRLLHFLPTHLSFREIADDLFVSANTVKTQARSIYRKLGVSSRAEAVDCARAAGLLEESSGPRPPD
jgi:LuxR family maltose regulon positive regulatory protein